MMRQLMRGVSAFFSRPVKGLSPSNNAVSGYKPERGIKIHPSVISKADASGLRIAPPDDANGIKPPASKPGRIVEIYIPAEPVTKITVDLADVTITIEPKEAPVATKPFVAMTGNTS